MVDFSVLPCTEQAFLIELISSVSSSLTTAETLHRPQNVVRKETRHNYAIRHLVPALTFSLKAKPLQARCLHAISSKLAKTMT